MKVTQVLINENNINYDNGKGLEEIICFKRSDNLELFVYYFLIEQDIVQNLIDGYSIKSMGVKAN